MALAGLVLWFLFSSHFFRPRFLLRCTSYTRAERTFRRGKEGGTHVEQVVVAGAALDFAGFGVDLVELCGGHGGYVGWLFGGKGVGVWGRREGGGGFGGGGLAG